MADPIHTRTVSSQMVSDPMCIATSPVRQCATPIEVACKNGGYPNLAGKGTRADLQRRPRRAVLKSLQFKPAPERLETKKTRTKEDHGSVNEI